MIALGAWRSSWALPATVASLLLLLVFMVHQFSSPQLPTSLDYFGVGRARSSEERPNLNFLYRYPAGPDGAVRFRGAPWKAEVGRWLSGCGATSAEVEIAETIGGKKCKGDCNGQGVCNKELGQCRCFSGYAGEDCSDKVKLDCNFPATPEEPWGGWVFSICSTHCDMTRAQCFCGEGLAYPTRPVTEACGFETIFPTEPGGRRYTDFKKADHDNLFTTDIGKRGWCNLDPKEAYAGRAKYKDDCHCRYDCVAGLFCEKPTVCSCINQCSGRGHCRHGSCQCESGWHGIDCGVPSISSPIKEWPNWLRPLKIEMSYEAESVKGTAMVKRRRPLIYIYDLPPEFNSNLIEGRHDKQECVNRIYSDQNKTEWTGMPYGAQISIYESLLASPHRTLNGEEADYFYVPVLDSCIIIRADDSPHFRMKEHLRSYLTLDFYKRAYDHIVVSYPYWNRSSGRDHLWFFSWDEGACCAPKEIWNSTMLVHWGNTNTKHNHSTTAYWLDSWNPIPPSARGDHPCFDPDKDLVLPSWKAPDPQALASKIWERPLKERKTFFYFNGNLGPAYNGRPEAEYSMRIRQKVAEEFASVPDKNGKLGKQHVKDVLVIPHRSDSYHDEIASSVFCGVFPGDGWSARMEDSILCGCIPVIIQDGIFLPYENVLNLRSFAVRIREDEIPNMINILKSMNEKEVESMSANVRLILKRFLYRDSVLLEAERQKKLFKQVDSWAEEYYKLQKEDDAFSTFIQVLHYKLHNDPWRKLMQHQQKQYGLPKTCMRESS